MRRNKPLERFFTCSRHITKTTGEETFQMADASNTNGHGFSPSVPSNAKKIVNFENFGLIDYKSV